MAMLQGGQSVTLPMFWGQWSVACGTCVGGLKYKDVCVYTNEVDMMKHMKYHEVSWIDPF